ncbi:MAG: hypothetical protein R6W75_09470 [Smithellaceae bacterium]
MKTTYHFSTRVYLLVLTLSLLGLLTSPGLIYADSPQDVVLSYNMETQVLTVSVTHKTTFTGLHYVKQIDIKKNGTTVGTYPFKSQPEKKTFTSTYEVPAGTGDVLEVNAICNLQGNKTATLTLTAGEAKN